MPGKDPLAKISHKWLEQRLKHQIQCDQSLRKSFIQSFRIKASGSCLNATLVGLSHASLMAFANKTQKGLCTRVRYVVGHDLLLTCFPARSHQTRKKKPKEMERGISLSRSLFPSSHFIIIIFFTLNNAASELYTYIQQPQSLIYIVRPVCVCVCSESSRVYDEKLNAATTVRKIRNVPSVYYIRIYFVCMVHVVGN